MHEYLGVPAATSCNTWQADRHRLEERMRQAFVQGRKDQHMRPFHRREHLRARKPAGEGNAMRKAELGRQTRELRVFGTLARNGYVDVRHSGEREQQGIHALPVRETTDEECVQAPAIAGRLGAGLKELFVDTVGNDRDALGWHAPTANDPGEVLARRDDELGATHPACSLADRVGPYLALVGVSLECIDVEICGPAIAGGLPHAIADDLQHEAPPKDAVHLADILLKQVHEDPLMPKHLAREYHPDPYLVEVSIRDWDAADANRSSQIRSVAGAFARTDDRDSPAAMRQLVAESIDERGRPADHGRKDVRDQQYPPPGRRLSGDR